MFLLSIHSVVLLATVADDTKGPGDWAAEYRRMRERYVAFTAALLHDLEMLLDGSSVTIAQIEARTKAVDSFAEKIERKDKYEDPLVEITDLSALRVIVHDPAGIQHVGELIRDEFAIDEENSVSRGADTDPDRFGYRAEHYVIRLKPEQLALAAWSQFADYTAEVQVRTVMQHAWAAVDHKIRYKGSDLPEDLERRLYRLNALLELADEQFAMLQTRSTERSESYAESVAQGDLNVDLDALSLAAYIEKSKVDRRWADAALKLGYSRPTVDCMDPAAVLETMRAADMRNLTDLQEVLQSAERWGEKALVRILDCTREGAPPGDKFAAIVAYRDEVLRLLILFNAGSEDAIEASDFRTDIQEGLLRAIAE